MVNFVMCVLPQFEKRERQRAILHRQARMRTEARIRGTRSKPRDMAASRGHSPAVLTTDFGAQNWEGTVPTRTAVGTGMHRIIGGEGPLGETTPFPSGVCPGPRASPTLGSHCLPATRSRRHVQGTPRDSRHVLGSLWWCPGIGGGRGGEWGLGGSGRGAAAAAGGSSPLATGLLRPGVLCSV